MLQTVSLQSVAVDPLFVQFFGLRPNDHLENIAILPTYYSIFCQSFGSVWRPLETTSHVATPPARAAFHSAPLSVLASFGSGTFVRNEVDCFNTLADLYT